MLRRFEVLRGMFVLRGIAAAHVTAGHAQPQVHPGIAHFQTLLTALGVRAHFPDLIQMGTWVHVAFIT